jgi:hypothetical protein
MNTIQSDFFEVLKTIFPDIHSAEGLAVKIQSRVKSPGVDLRDASFLGVITDDLSIGTIEEFINKSLSFHFKCSHGDIHISCKKEEHKYVFHPLEILELSRSPQTLDLVLMFKDTFQATLKYPIKQVERINPYAVKGSIV